MYMLKINPGCNLFHSAKNGHPFPAAFAQVSHGYVGVGTEQPRADDLIGHDIRLRYRSVVRLGSALPRLCAVSYKLDSKMLG